MAFSFTNAFNRLLGRPLNAEEVIVGSVNSSQDAIRVEPTPPTSASAGTAAAVAAVDAAPDKVDTFTYLDAGAADERISTIVHSSALVGRSYTETFAYAGSAGAYRISTITTTTS